MNQHLRDDLERSVNIERQNDRLQREIDAAQNLIVTLREVAAGYRELGKHAEARDREQHADWWEDRIEIWRSRDLSTAEERIARLTKHEVA